jgi:membrane protein DedA with SNARE-associated domain
MLAAESTGFVETLAAYMGHFAYGGVFFALFFAGWLIPLPEEPLLIAAGYLSYDQRLNVWLMIACAMTGLLCGDLMIFSIGRRHGDWVFRRRIFRWLLPAERLDRARRLFAEHGSKMAFFGRFIAGIRLVVFFTAGNLGVPVATFIVYDFLAAMLTIPISVYAGHYFGSDIADALKVAGRWRKRVIFSIIAVTVVLLVIRALRARGRRAALEAEAAKNVGSSLEKAEHA